jgi:hypothetical protein
LISQQKILHIEELEVKEKIIINKDLSIEILETVIDKYIQKKYENLRKYLLKRKENEVIIEITPIKTFYWDYTNRMNNNI